MSGANATIKQLNPTGMLVASVVSPSQMNPGESDELLNEAGCKVVRQDSDRVSCSIELEIPGKEVQFDQAPYCRDKQAKGVEKFCAEPPDQVWIKYQMGSRVLLRRQFERSKSNSDLFLVAGQK
jgi:hypothetical protein